MKNLSSGTRVVLKSHYGYEVMSLLCKGCGLTKYFGISTISVNLCKLEH